MKKISGILLGCFIFISPILISGCCLITGSCIILEGVRADEMAERLITPPNFYSEFWENPSMSDEQKQKDWLACGGGGDGKFSPPYNRKSDGDSSVFIFKASKKFEHCLSGKGYLCTGCFVQTKDYPFRTDASFWEKLGVSIEQRQKDWVACGGTKDGFFNPPIESNETKAIYEESRIKNRIFQHCLIGKGYRWMQEKCTSSWGMPVACCSGQTSLPKEKCISDWGMPTACRSRAVKEGALK